MANELKPFGFRPVQDRTGGVWAGKTRAVVVSGSDANNIFIGDMVKFTGTEIEVDGQYYSVITLAAASDTRLAGAVTSFKYPADGYASYNAANSGSPRIAYIPQDPNTMYVAQENDNMGASGVESNADFVVGTGDTTTGLSGSSINSSTSAVTSTLPLRVVARDLSPDNEAGQYSNWYVTINQNAYNDKAGLA